LGNADQSVSQEAVDTYGRSISLVMDWPPIPGRLAMLLMMSGEEMDIPSMREALGVSTGSLSESTRLLINAGVIERVKIPGQRKQVFRWREDAWVGCVMHQAQQISTIKQVAVDAVANPDLTPAQLASFTQMLAFYTVLSDAMDTIAGLIAERYAATGQYARDEPLVTRPESPA